MINCDNKNQIVELLNGSINNHLVSIRNFLQSPTVPESVIPQSIFNIEKPLPQLGIKQPDWFSMSSFSMTISLTYEWFQSIVAQNLTNLNEVLEESAMLNGLPQGASGYGPDEYVNLSYIPVLYASNTFRFTYDPNQSYLRVNTPNLTEEQRVKAAYDLRVNPAEQIARASKYRPDMIVIDICGNYGNPLIWKSNVITVDGNLASRSIIVNRYPNIKWIEPLIDEIHKNGIKCIGYWKPLFNFLDLVNYPASIGINGVIQKYVRSTCIARSIFSENYKNFIKDLMVESVKPVVEGGLGLDGIYWDYSFTSDYIIDFSKDALDIWAKYLGFLDSEDPNYVNWSFAENNFPFPDLSLGEAQLKGDGSHLYGSGDREGTALFDLINNDIGFITEIQKANILRYANLLREKYNEILYELSLAVESASYANAVFIPSIDWHCYIERSDVNININAGRYGQAMKSEFAVEPRGYHRLRPRSSFYSPEDYANPPGPNSCNGNPASNPPVSVLAGTKEAEIAYADINRPDMFSVMNLSQKLDYCGGNKTSLSWKAGHAPYNPPVGSPGAVNNTVTFNTNQFRNYPTSYLFGGSANWSGDDSIVGYLRGAYQICLKNAAVLDVTCLGADGWSGDLPRNESIDYGDGYYNIYGTVSPSKNYAFFRKTAYHQKKIKEQMSGSGLDFSKRNMYAWIGIHVSDSGRQGIGTHVKYMGDFADAGLRYLKQCKGTPSGVGENVSSSITYKTNSLGQNWGQFYWPIIGPMEALEEKFIPYATLTDEHILKSDFSGLDVILIPHREWLSDLQLTRLQEFMDRGGKVVYVDEIFYSPNYEAGDPRLKGRFYDFEDRYGERSKFINYIISNCGESPLAGSIIENEYSSSYQSKQCAWYKYSDIGQDGTFTIGAHLINDMSWMDMRKHSSQYGERWNELDPSTVPYKSDTNPKLNGIMDYDLFGWGPSWRTEWYNTLTSDPNPSDNVEAPPIPTPDGNNNLAFYEPLPKNMWGKPLVGGYSGKYWSTQLRLKLPQNYKIVKVCKIYVSQENEPLDVGVTKSATVQSLILHPSDEISYYYDDSSKSWLVTVSKIGMHCLVGFKIQKQISFTSTCKKIFAYTSYPAYTSSEFDFDYNSNFLNTNLTRMHLISDIDLYGYFFDNSLEDKKYNFYSYNGGAYHADACFNHIKRMYIESGFNASYFDGYIGLEFSNLNYNIINAILGSEDILFTESKNKIIDVVRDLKNILPNAKIGLINFPPVPYSGVNFSWFSLTEEAKFNLSVRAISILEDVIKECDFITVPCLIDYGNVSEVNGKVNYASILSSSFRNYLYNKNISCDIYAVLSKEFRIYDSVLSDSQIDSIFNAFVNYVDGYFIYSNLRRNHYYAFIDADPANDASNRERLQFILGTTSPLNFNNSFNLINEYTQSFKNYLVGKVNSNCNAETSAIVNANKVSSMPHRGPKPPVWLKRSAKFIKATFSASDIKDIYKSIVHLLPGITSPSPTGNCLYVSNYQSVNNFYYYEANQACAGEATILDARTNFSIAYGKISFLYNRSKYYLNEYPDGVVINAHDHDEPLWWNTNTPIKKWDILSNNLLHGMNVNIISEAINIIKNNSPRFAVLADINPCAFITLDESVYPFAVNCFGLRVEKKKGGNDRCQFRSFLNQNMVNVISYYHAEAFNLGLDGILWNEPIISDFGDFEYSVRDRFAKYKGYVGADDPFFTELFPFPISCGTSFGNYVLKYFNPNLPTNICKGDRNQNGIVDNLDAIDFNLAASNFSTNAEDLNAFDFDGDGIVTFSGDGPFFNAVLGTRCYDLKCDQIIVDHTLNIPTVKQLVCDLPVDGAIYSENMRKMLIEYANFCSLLAQNNILYISNMIESSYGVGQKIFAPYVSSEAAYRFNGDSNHSMSINANSINVDSGIRHQFYLNKRSALSVDQNIAEIQRFSMSLGENLGLDIISGNHNKPVFVRMNPKIWQVNQNNLSSWSAYDSSNNTNIVEDGIVREDAIRGYLTSNYFNYVSNNFYPIIEMFSFSDWGEENYIPGNPSLPNVLNYSDIDRDPPRNNTPFLRNLFDILKKIFSANFNSHLHSGSNGYQKHAWIGIHHADKGRNALCLSDELSAFSEFYTKQFINLSDFGYSGTLGWGDFYWSIVGSVEMCTENGIPHALLNDFTISDGNFSGLSVIIIPHKKLLSSEQLYKLSGFNGLVVYLDDLYGNYENIYNVWHSSVESNGILESVKAKNSLYNYIINSIGNPPLQLSLVYDEATSTSIAAYNNKRFNVYDITEPNQMGYRRLEIAISNDRAWADVRPNLIDNDPILSSSRLSDLINVNYTTAPFSSLYFNDSFYKDGTEIPTNGLFVWYSGYPPAGFGKNFVYKISLKGAEKIRNAQAIVVDASTNSSTYHNLIIQNLANEDIVFTPPISEFATISLIISENALPSSSSSSAPASSSSSAIASSSSSVLSSSSSSAISSSSSRPSSSSSRPSSSSSRPSSSSSRPSSSSSSFRFPSSSSVVSSSSSSVVTFPSSSDEAFTFPSSSSSSRPTGSSSTAASSSTVTSSSSSSYVTAPFAATYVLETDSVTNIEKEFGIEYYNTGFGGSVGDSVNIDFTRLQPLSVAKADSYSGIITLYNGTKVGKYDSMSIEIKSESFRFAGVVGHDVLEDSFEGVNVGLSSSLGQVQNANIIDQAIDFNKVIYSDASLLLYYVERLVQEKPVDNLMQTDFTSAQAFIDSVKSDVFYNLLSGAEEDTVSIGVMQDVLYINDSRLLIIGLNGFAVFDNYNFVLPDYRFQQGEILLNAVVWNNKIYLFTSNQILIFNYDLELLSERNYNDYVGQIVFGYVSDNGIFISTSNGFYVTKHDIDLFVRLFAPIIQESNSIDIIAKYSIYNNVAIFLGNDIYWSSNLNDFGRIKTTIVGSKINGISKFFNRNIFASDNGLYMSSTNMLASSQLQATILSGSVVPQESSRFVDVVTLSLSVAENIIQSTVYAVRDDGVVFVSQDPSNYFDKIVTNINKPAKIVIYGDDILVISSFNLYSFNQEKVYTLKRSVL